MKAIIKANKFELELHGDVVDISEAIKKLGILGIDASKGHVPLPYPYPWEYPCQNPWSWWEPIITYVTTDNPDTSATVKNSTTTEGDKSE